MMSTARRRVILCKARVKDEQDSDKNYARLLESAGFICDQLSVLQFEFINLEELYSRLLTPHSHSGLILTSPRCVEALKLAVENREMDAKCVLNEWKTLPAYCVGAATDRVARGWLNLELCCGSKTGNAKELAKLIVNEVQLSAPMKPLLYPCSMIVRDTITNALGSAGIAFEKISVYNTRPSETLRTDLDELLYGSLPEFLVLFSPSAVKYVIEALRQSHHDDAIRQVKFVAIGPVTEQALVDAGLTIYATSNQPEPEALLHALIDNEKNC